MLLAVHVVMLPVHHASKTERVRHGGRGPKSFRLVVGILNGHRSTLKGWWPQGPPKSRSCSFFWGGGHDGFHGGFIFRCIRNTGRCIGSACVRTGTAVCLSIQSTTYLLDNTLLFVRSTLSFSRRKQPAGETRYITPPAL